MCAPRGVAAVVIGFGVLTGLLPARAAAEMILYKDPSTFVPGLSPHSSDGAGIYFSQNDPGTGGAGLYQVVFANFILSQTASLSGIQWQGGFNDPAAGMGNIMAFHIAIWGNNPNAAFVDIGTGQPGTGPGPNAPNAPPFSTAMALASATILQGNFTETAAGSPNTEKGGANLIFDYSASLPAGFFTAQSGQEYWLSIWADLDSSTTTTVGFWGWHTGTLADGSFGTSVLDTLVPSQVNRSTAGFYSAPNTEAFTLTGNALAVVPEPSSMALVGLGVAALAGWARMRRRAV